MGRCLLLASLSMYLMLQTCSASSQHKKSRNEKDSGGQDGVFRNSLSKLHIHLIQRLKNFTDRDSDTPIVVRAASSRKIKSVSKSSKNEVEPEKGMVQIGQTKYSKQHVTKIGDIDRNGIDDYVVANPSANRDSGSIRLYLMGEQNQFLFSRELIPGKWGFNGPSLKSGDRYGAAVLSLAPLNNDSACTIVVGAPGDNANYARKGAIYILKISDRGSVLSASKISADTMEALEKQQAQEEGFGSHIKVIGDLNGDGVDEIFVKSRAGSTTLLFMNATGEVKTGLKLHDEIGDTPLLKFVNQRKAKPQRKLMTLGIGNSFTVRAGITSHCFFNETSCACSKRAPAEGSRSCMDVVGKDTTTGRTLCKPRACEPSYSCSCDGQELCNLSELTKEVYVSDGEAVDGNVFCSLSAVNFTKAVVQTGVPVPGPVESQELSPFNETHCRCSPKRDVQGPSECLDYLRDVTNIAILCSARQCQDRDDDFVCDGLGNSYCSKEQVENEYYANDGNTANPDEKYCHKAKHTVEKLTLIS